MPLLMEHISDFKWEWLAHLFGHVVCNTSLIFNASLSQTFIVAQKFIQSTIKSVINFQLTFNKMVIPIGR